MVVVRGYTLSGMNFSTKPLLQYRRPVGGAVRVSRYPQGQPAVSAVPPGRRVIDAQVDRLEREIDAMNARLQPLRSFILPGGSALAAHLHLCRTVSRRAERLTVELATMEQVNEAAVKYLNRLSDWFFVAGRIANNDGKDDVLWVPGLTR